MSHRAFSIPIAPGSEPEPIDDLTMVYEDAKLDDFGFIVKPCDKSPSHQCEYSMTNNFERCVHCGRESGL